ncbi:hypothetical protein TTHERM_00239100 (macronuclear) [Tetrahymena thermophila SB210]|uniref:RanBP2-type domain-containing protein n=1 Tax=Tetrahymena thermophila (strain SB210) TaxID=312017 RepID=I7MAH2_TETTS|nr:hypothetical protein TTHERM_00239100 [Tetrahymena thermophila SB210]EAS04590.1 hypothetical protein TTHERM_00239100 [Tetrahymena thermophila SB210]|eukprot:XP_001024835.1 hypothetical protein TTHERM_00239100 [Tetrahymena thermophila SB210]
MDSNKQAKGGQGIKTKSNGGGTQVITQKQQIQQQKQEQKKQPQKKIPNKPPTKLKGGVRLDGEIDDDLNIQNEQNQKWQCQNCKYINEKSSTECQKCVHLQKLKQEQEKDQ